MNRLLQIIFAITALAFASSAEAATKYFCGLTNSNWSTDGNWSTTSSLGPANTTKAVNGDAVTLDITSPACIIDAASACTSIVCTGYTSTLTFNATLTAAGTVTFASGMTIAGTSDLICTTTATLTSGGKMLTGGLQLQGTSQTFTLSGAWVVNGLLQANGTTSASLNSSTLSVGGGITTTVSLNGSTVITITGGTWTGAVGTLNISLTIAGNITVSGTVLYATGTLTYTSGTVTTTSSTLSLGNANTTLSTSGVSWNNITITGATRTYTVNSSLTILGTLTLPNSNTTFAGSAGFTCATLSLGTLTASRTHTLKSTNTYTVTSSILVVGTTPAITCSLVANTPGSKAILTVNSGADMSLAYVNPTDIDSSGGIPVYTYKGTITTSTNWVAGSLTLPTAVNVKIGSGAYGYSDAAITPSYTAGAPSISGGTP